MPNQQKINSIPVDASVRPRRRKIDAIAGQAQRDRETVLHWLIARARRQQLLAPF